MTKNTWPADKVERVRVDTLTPYAKNSRTHSDEQIAQVAASIREWGFTVPILRDESGMVIAGHARLAAAMRLGLQEVPVMTAVGWGDAQKRAYVIADNKLAINADWDYEMLSLELEVLGNLDIDMTLTGFSEGELSNLLNADWDPPQEEPLDEPGGEAQKGHSIHFSAEEAEYWNSAFSRLQEDAPDLTESRAVLLLANAYGHNSPALSGAGNPTAI